MSKTSLMQRRLAPRLHQLRKKLLGAGVAPTPARLNGSGYRVRLEPGRVVSPDRTFALDYTTTQEPILLWQPADNRATHFTILNGESGSGKSTLLLDLYSTLRVAASSKLQFHFDPDNNDRPTTSVGYIPQHPPFVPHWRVSELVPPSSLYVKRLLADRASEALESRLGVLAGGEKLRVLLASVLEQLASDAGHAAFLLLDETLDGLGAKGIADCLRAIADTWQEQSETKPLHAILISHHLHEDVLRTLRGEDLPVHAVRLAVKSRQPAADTEPSLTTVEVSTA